MSQEIDYVAVLADLESRRAALEAAITAVKAILGLGPTEATSGSAGVVLPSIASEGPKEVVAGVFHGMSVSEAARKYLEMKKTKQKTRAISEALLLGGIESDSKNFYGNVYTTLQRNKDFIRLGKYWALTEWHPTRAMAPSKPARKTRRAKKARGAQRKRQADESGSSTSPPNSSEAV